MRTGDLRPERVYSAAVRRLARCRWPPLRRALIAWAIRHYRVEMSEADPADPAAYPSFNAFFTRPLRPGVRPLPARVDAVCAPADGTVSAIGEIESGTLLQAKSHTFALSALLGDDGGLARSLEPGRFVTIYLSPRDYHRVHAPLAGRVRRMVHVPGRLFSVNQRSVERVHNLFARNERLVFEIETGAGRYALVMVGAVGVSLIETAWSGRVDNRGPSPREWRYSDAEAPVLDRGQELGRFNLGSSVILVGPSTLLPAWGPAIRPGSQVRMGEALDWSVG